MIHVSCHALIKIMGTRSLVYDPGFRCRTDNHDYHFRDRRACDLQHESHANMVLMETMRDRLGLGTGAKQEAEGGPVEITCSKCAVMYDQAIQFRESNAPVP